MISVHAGITRSPRVLTADFLLFIFLFKSERVSPLVRFGSWLRENSEIDFANRNFVLTSINLKNKSAGDGCRDKTIEKTILRTFRARTFSRSLGHQRTLPA